MQSIKSRFSSRKFLLAIAGLVLVTLTPEHADNVVKVIGFFIGAEGLADVVQRYRN